MDGVLIINKPQGITSHDVVDCARKHLGTKRIGHAGTLDPLATGVLILLVGKATKLFNSFAGLDKEYAATVTLGKVTTTGDSCGSVITTQDYTHITKEKAAEVVSSFQGEQEQVPPMFSALKHKGKKLYQLARKGIEIPRLARRVVIQEIQLTRFALPDLDLYIKCSKGTYVRKLAEDIGERLGCGGYISRIERLSVGGFKLADAIGVDQISARHLRQWR